MDTLVESLLAYRANAPVIDQLLTEAGFPNHGNPVATPMGGAATGSLPNGKDTAEEKGAG